MYRRGKYCLGLVILMLACVLSLQDGARCEEDILITNILCKEANVKYPEKQGEPVGAIIDINFTQPVECRVYQLNEPFRVIVDPMPEVFAKFKQDKITINEAGISEISLSKAASGSQAAAGPEYYPVDFIVILPSSPAKYTLVTKDNTVKVYLGELQELIDKY